MQVTIFGAAGPTGLSVCTQALRERHHVVAVSRRHDPIPIDPHKNLTQIRADAQTGEGMGNAVASSDVVLSILGASYSRRPIDIYSSGTRNIVDAMRAKSAGRRLVVVSSGLTYPPPSMNWVADAIVFPVLRHVIGRTLYANMRAMEELLQDSPDIDWTVMRPGRLTNARAVSDYRLDDDYPAQGYTTRPDLAAAMVAEIAGSEHIHRAVAPTTTRKVRQR